MQSSANTTQRNTTHCRAVQCEAKQRKLIQNDFLYKNQSNPKQCRRKKAVHVRGAFAMWRKGEKVVYVALPAAGMQ
eukprot:7477403-Pyramimonas_sp.AAC.1